MVFMASPGDLSDEREAVRRAAEHVNTLFSAVSTVRLSVVGWEHVQPGFGRPQAIINPLVDQCDVFVGMLNLRWGTPTGQFSSGFEEEYEQAARRTKELGRPYLAVFFKEVPKDRLEDPGQELTKVLNFRRRLEDEHIALYKQFSTIEDFELKITRYLSSVIVDQLQNYPAEIVSPEGTVDKQVKDDLPRMVSEPQIDDEARRQIASTLNSFHRLAENGRGEGDDALDEDRLLMFAMAAQQETVSIPIHSLNRIYSNRDHYVLSVMEWRLLVWTVADNFQMEKDGKVRSYAPGFKMIANPSSLDDLEDMLVLQIFRPGVDPSVGKGSLNILREMKARPAELWGAEEVGVGQPTISGSAVSLMGQAPIDRWVHMLENYQLEDAAFGYAFVVMSDSDAALFDIVGERLGDTSTAAKVRALAGYARGSIVEITELGATRYISEDSCFEEMIISSLSQMDIDQVSSIVSGRALPGRVIRHALDVLSVQRAPSVDEFGKVLETKNAELVEFAFDVASRLGEEATQNLLAAAAKLKDVGSLGKSTNRLRSLVRTEEELRAELLQPWSFGDAWSALTWLDGAAFVDEAREILDTNCSNFLDGEKLQEAGYSEKLQNYLKSDLRKSALELLARLENVERTPEDIDRFRTELARDDFITVDQAAQALALLGSSVDADSLLTLASNSYGGKKEQLLAGAVKLGGLDMARGLVLNADEQVALAATRELVSVPSVPVTELKELLYSTHDSVRMEAWRAVEKRLDRGDLEEYLTEYSARPEGYYYDVVAAMDRRLYLPQ